ncbi:MAG: hypothetical protein MJZ68_01300 [archaeon]|nr:hypothetical protein [archaeon]
MNKKILMVAVVAVIAIVAVAAVLMLNGGDNNEAEKTYKPLDSVSDYPCYMPILGNANLDTTFDSKDVNLIQKFIDDKTAEKSGYKYADYYMYDANNDGKIDSADVTVVKNIISALKSNDWSAVKDVYYVNCDMNIVSYDMSINNKVITLIAPPLDTVLAIGGKDLVVGTDNRITTGKYHAEYDQTLDFSHFYDVGSCNEPDTEIITNAAKEYGGVNIVCGNSGSYGPSLEKVFDGTNVQVIRIASWEYGETLYGLLTAGFLLKCLDGANEYLDWYKGVENTVQGIVKLVKDPSSEGAAATYAYADELSLLGDSTGEYANLMLLKPYDSANAFLNGSSGGHGNTISVEDVNTLYKTYKLRNLFLMIGTPFQVTVDSDGYGNGQSTTVNTVNLFKKWSDRIGTSNMDDLDYCITGYSFSSGVSEVLNQLIQCYFMYHDEFLTYFKCSDDKAAHDVLAGYVDAYCKAISIDGLWSFYGEENGGKAGTHGMNLLYCGEGDSRNIMYGMDSGVLKF